MLPYHTLGKYARKQVRNLNNCGATFTGTRKIVCTIYMLQYIYYVSRTRFEIEKYIFIMRGNRCNMFAKYFLP